MKPVVNAFTRSGKDPKEMSATELSQYLRGCDFRISQETADKREGQEALNTINIRDGGSQPGLPSNANKAQVDLQALQCKAIGKEMEKDKKAKDKEAKAKDKEEKKAAKKAAKGKGKGQM